MPREDRRHCRAHRRHREPVLRALYFLYRDRGHGERMVKALAIRVALSATLVIFLVASYKLGWIAPTGLR